MITETTTPSNEGEGQFCLDSDQSGDLSAFGQLDSEGPSHLGVELVNPLAGTNWDHLVGRHPDASFFHSSAWAKVLAGTYRHQPFYLRFSEEEKTVALLPLFEVASTFTGRRAVCLPFSDSCPPLLFPGVDLSSLRHAVGALARERKWRHVEFRGESGLAAEDRLPATFYGHTLDLQAGAETLFSRFDGSVRRAIRKGEASDLRVHVERTPEALEEFVSLHALTRKRHGVPPQPRRFFSQIYEQIIRPGSGFVVLARRGATAVAAAIFFVWADKAIYKFGASDQSEQSLRGKQSRDVGGDSFSRRQRRATPRLWPNRARTRWPSPFQAGVGDDRENNHLLSLRDEEPDIRRGQSPSPRRFRALFQSHAPGRQPSGRSLALPSPRLEVHPCQKSPSRRRRRSASAVSCARCSSISARSCS